MRIIILAALILTAACVDPYEEVEARVAAYNPSGTNTVQAVVNGQDVGEIIFPGRASQFTIIVRVPRETDRIIGVDYREAKVTVAFRNLTAGTMTEPDWCYAGEGMVTSMTYWVDSGREGVSCDSP